MSIAHAPRVCLLFYILFAILSDIEQFYLKRFERNNAFLRIADEFRLSDGGIKLRYRIRAVVKSQSFVVELIFRAFVRYAAAAEVLQWAEDNFEIIRNSVFFGDAPEDGGVYGYYAFDGKRGILAIRNSTYKDKS